MWATIILGKQVIIKLSLAYSFQKVFFIGQNLKHVYMTFVSWTFDLLLVKYGRYLVLWVLKEISYNTKKILLVNTNFIGKKPIIIKPIKTNILTYFLYWCWKSLFVNVMLKLLLNNFWSFEVSLTHFQKQLFVDLLQNRRSLKYSNEHLRWLHLYFQTKQSFCNLVRTS